MDDLLIILPILIAHLPIIILFMRKTLQSKFPGVVDFAGLGIVLYFDLGLFAEFVGFQYANPLLPSFYSGDDAHQILIIIILMVTPYLYYLGARFSDPNARAVSQQRISNLVPDRRNLFYLLIIVTAVSLGWWSYRFYVQDPLAVMLRLRQFNLPINLPLLIPVSLLAFYVRQQESATIKGISVTIILFLTSVIAVLPLSSRTALLLPFLIVVLFYFRMSPARLLLFLVVGLILAVALIPLYTAPARWGRVSELDEIQWRSQLEHVVFQDFYRAHVTLEVVDRTELMDSEVLSYPMSGYVYGLLYFAPRSIAPFKGRSTALQFSADYLGYDSDDVTLFGFGHSTIDEILLNGGFLFLVPGLILYGAVMGLFDKLSRRIPSLLVPTRLAALWSGGYVISVLIHFYGTMFLICLALHILFVRRNSVANKVVIRESDDNLSAEALR